MKILVLVNELHRAGGVERSLATKTLAWVASGHHVSILTLDDPGNDFFPFPKEVTRFTLRVQYKRNERLISIHNAKVAIRHYFELRRFLLSMKYDLVINSIYGYSFFFLPMASPSATRVISENHSSRFVLPGSKKAFIERCKARIRRTFETMYDKVLFLSDEEAQISGLENALVIPNALAPLGPSVRLVDDKKKRPHVIAAGRICHVKGFDRLVDAWALAATRIPGWSLHIYGDGEPHDVAELEAQITRYGLCDRVKLWPATSEIQARMAESAIYAMTSRSECFPMVLLEAMQLGLPVVAFDCPTGPRNIVQHEVTGRLIADGDVHAFSAALVSLALDFDARARMGRASREVARRYEVEQVMSAWEALFNDKP